MSDALSRPSVVRRAAAWAPLELSVLTLDGGELDHRLRKRLSFLELLAVTLDLAVVCAFALIHPDTLHYDLSNYLKVAQGDFSFFYYAYWLAPLFVALGTLPTMPVYLLWSAANVGAVWFAARVFGGKGCLVLLSYQMFYLLYQGQLTGIVIGALGLLWWGMAHRRWYIAGIGLIIAATKFQTGMTLGLILLLMAPISPTDRLRILVIPSIAAAFSFAVYPGWIGATLTTLQTNPPNVSGNISLWRWLGPGALLFWIPPLVIPIDWRKRLVALGATATFAVPYFQQVDLLALFVLPVGWLPVLGNLGYLITIIDYAALQMLVIIPLLLYGFILVPAVGEWYVLRRNLRAKPGK